MLAAGQPRFGEIENGTSVPGADLVPEKGSQEDEDSHESVKVSIDKRPTIPIYLRIRPIEDGLERFIVVLNDEEVEILPPIIPKDDFEFKAERYKFTRVFGESSTQEEIYASVVDFHVDQMLNAGNKNGLILAYGASGSGKTFSSTGGSSTTNGMLHMALSKVLNHVGNAHTTLQVQPLRWSELEVTSSAPLHDNSYENMPARPGAAKGYKYAVFMSFFEIYLDQVYDLQANYCLTDRKCQYYHVHIVNKRPSLQIREDACRKRYVSDIIETRIYDMDKAQEIIRSVLASRTAVETRINSSSSRSHFFATIKLLKIPLDESNRPMIGEAQVGQLTIADLAGAERVMQSKVGESGKKESGNINRSLHSFGMCLEALRDNQKKPMRKPPVIIPWRMCKLTLILQPYFEYGSVSFLIHVNPSARYSCVTGEVFRFARKAGALLQPRDISQLDRHNISARLGSSKEDLGSDLKDLPLGKANTSQFGPTSNVGTCNDVVDIEKRLGDVHKLHRDDLLVLANNVASYKKTIQEYEDRLKEIELAQRAPGLQRFRLHGSKGFESYQSRGKYSSSIYNTKKLQKTQLNYGQNASYSHKKTADKVPVTDEIASSIGVCEWPNEDLSIKALNSLEAKLIGAYNQALNAGRNDITSHVKDCIGRISQCINGQRDVEMDSGSVPDDLDSKKDAEGLARDLCESNNTLKAQVESLSVENAELNRTLQSLRKDLEEARLYIQKLGADYLQSSRSLATSEEQLKALTECIDAKEKLVNSSAAELGVLAKEFETQGRELAEANIEIDRLKKELSKEAEKLADANLSAQKNSESAENLSNNLIMAKSQNKVLERLLATHEERIKQLTFQVEQLNGDNAKLQKLMLEEDKKSKERNDYTETLNMALQKVKGELEIAGARIENFECDISSEKAENQRLRRVISEKDTYIATLKEQSGLFSNIISKAGTKLDMITISRQRKVIFNNTNAELAEKHKCETEEVVESLESGEVACDLRQKDVLTNTQTLESSQETKESTPPSEESSSVVNEQSELLESLKSKVESLERELTEYKSKNIEKSLSLSEALLKAKDDKKKEAEAITSIKKIMQEFSDVHTLQELTYAARQLAIKKASEDNILGYKCCDLRHGNSTVSNRRSEVIKPSHRLSLYQKVVRRLSDLPVLKDSAGKFATCAVDANLQSELFDSDDYRIIGDIILDIDYLSEKLSNMDNVIRKYEKEEENKEAEVQLLEVQKSMLMKDVKSYQDSNVELSDKVKMLESELSQLQRSVSPQNSVLCKGILSRVLLLESWFSDFTSELERVVKCERQISPKRILTIFIEEFIRRFNCTQDSLMKSLDIIPGMDDICIYADYMSSLASLLDTGYQNVCGIKKILSSQIDSMDTNTNVKFRVEDVMDTIRRSREEKERELYESVKKFTDDFMCTIRIFIINDSEVKEKFQTIYSKIKGLEVIIESSELAHGGNAPPDVITFSDTLQLLSSMHDTLDKLNLRLCALSSKVRESELTRQRDLGKSLINCHSSDIDSIVAASASLKKFLECNGDKPISSFVSQDTLTNTVLHMWTALVVPLADRIFNLKTTRSGQKKTLDSPHSKPAVESITPTHENDAASRKSSSVLYASPRTGRKIERFDVDDDELVEAPAIFDFSRRTHRSPASFNRSTKSFNAAPLNAYENVAGKRFTSRLSTENSPRTRVGHNTLHPISPNVKMKIEENFVPQKQKFKIDDPAWDEAIESEIKSSNSNSNTTSSIPVLKRMRKLGKRKALVADGVEEDHSEDEGYEGKRYSSIALRLEDN